MSTPSSAPRQAKDADAAAKSASKSLPGSAKKAVARTGVLTETVQAFTRHRATVKLWTTSVRGGAHKDVPQAGFETVTVNLAWLHGDWKAAKFAKRDGPNVPLAAQQTTSAAKDFAPYAAARARDPVFRGRTHHALPEAPERGRAGARAAAVNTVTLQSTPRFMVDGSWRKRVLRATTAPSVLDAVSQDADSTAQLITQNRGVGADGKSGDGGRLVMRTAVLGTRTLTHSPHTARVKLWTASLGGLAHGDETQAPQISFQRMRVELTRTDGGWKSTSVSTEGDLVPAVAAGDPTAAPSDLPDGGGETDAAARS